MLELKRRIIGWLGLVLIAFNLAAGAALPVALSSLNDDSIICTARGMISRAAQDAQQSSGSEHSDKADLCQFCMPLMHGGMDSVAEFIPTTPGLRLSIPADLRLADQIDIRSTDRAANHSPRSPPSLTV